MNAKLFPRIRESDCSEPATDTPVDIFRTVVLGQIQRVSEVEMLPLLGGLGRVLAEDVVSRVALPGFDRAAMDGFGVGAGDLARGSHLRIVDRPDRLASVEPGCAVRLHTGAAVPPGIVAVARRERCLDCDGVVELRDTVPVGADIRRRGEDVREGDRLAKAGAVIDARLVALLASAGIAEIVARRPIRLAILSTGDELVGTDGALPLIHDSNRPMLSALLARPGVTVIDGGIVRDDATEQANALATLAEGTDLILCSGGTAGSAADHLPEAARRAGGTARSYRLALRPGRPIVLGTVGGALLLGLPGNPLAAFVSAQLFALPAIAALAGETASTSSGEPAVLAGNERRRPGVVEFAPGSVVGHGADGRPIVQLSPSGSARLLPLASADGLVELAVDGTVRFHRGGRIA